MKLHLPPGGDIESLELQELSDCRIKIHRPYFGRDDDENYLEYKRACTEHKRRARMRKQRKEKLRKGELQK